MQSRFHMSRICHLAFPDARNVGVFHSSICLANPITHTVAHCVTRIHAQAHIILLNTARQSIVYWIAHRCL